MAFTEFPNSQALGSGPSADTAQYLRPRPDVARDCTYNDSSGRGRYCWRATTSEHDGVLDIWLHTETGSCHNGLDRPFTKQHDPAGGCNFVSAPLAQTNRQCIQDVHLVSKYPLLPGRKIAHLLWNTGTNVNGEEDHPEGKLDGGSNKGIAAHHYYGGGGQRVWDLNTNLQAWHLWTLRFHCNNPTGTGFVEFWMDGHLIGRSTDRIPPDPMWWVAQIETYLAGQAIPELDGQGHVLFDAFAVDIPN